MIERRSVYHQGNRIVTLLPSDLVGSGLHLVPPKSARSRACLKRKDVSAEFGEKRLSESMSRITTPGRIEGL